MYMQSVIENLSGLSRKIKVTIPQEQVSEEFDKRVKELAKNANIKGFRKGKVPISIIKLQYGNAIRQEVIQDILQKALPQAFKEKNIYPAGLQAVEVTNAKEDSPLEFEAQFEVYPEVKVNIEGISIEKPHTKIDEAHVSDMIEKVRKQNVHWNEVDRPAEAGDLVIIDYAGYMEGSLVEDASVKDFRLELGSKQMIPGFEDNLYGVKPDEEVEFNISFPEDYTMSRYAGKPIKFLVHLKKVMAPELPALDDDFVKSLGVTDGTLAGLHAEVRENLERELSHRIHNQVRAQIIDKVLEKNNIEVPHLAVDKEIERLQKMIKKQFMAQTGSKDAPQLPRENVENQARKNVMLSLLLAQWIEDNEIKVDEAKVRSRIDQIASGYHQPQEIVNWYYGNKGALEEIEAAVLEEQAIEKMLENVEVVEKEVSFEEIMNIETQRGNK
jgi:trigger factor